MNGVAAEVRDAPGRGLLSAALAAAAVAIFFTNFDNFFFILSLAPPPSNFVALFIAAALALIVLEPGRPLYFLRSPFGAWVLAFVVVTLAWAPWMAPHPDVEQEVTVRLRSAATVLAFCTMFDDARARRAGVLAVAVGVAFASLANLVEIAGLVTFPVTEFHARADGRAGAFYFNPNGAGIAIALGAALTIEALPRWMRAPYIVLAAFGIAATFSRGAAVCLLVAFLFILWRRALGTGYVVLVVVAAVVLGVYGVAYMQAHDLLNENTAARLALAKDDSGRIELVAKAWGLFWRSPWFGEGIGSTIIWAEQLRAHNQYVTYAADHGVVGLLLFPALAVAVYASNRASGCFALVLAVCGFFSHSVVEDRYSVLLLALAATPGAAAAAAPSRNRTEPAPATGG